MLIRLFLIIVVSLFPLASLSDERMADVGAYVSSVWFAEEFNEHCPNTPLEVPVTEAELRTLLMLTEGGNLVDNEALQPTPSDMSAREHMKDMARQSIVDGCDSEIALMMKARVAQELVVPALIKELQETNEPLRSKQPPD